MAKTRSRLAVEAGVGYTIGNILIKGISFISIPIFARLLTVSDYGIYNTFSAYVSILGIIISFALHTSIKNAKIDFPTKIDEYSASITIPIIINAIFLTIISIGVSLLFPSVLKIDPPVIIILIVVESFSMAMINFYNSVLSVNYRYKEYLILSLTYSLAGILISIVLCLSIFNTTRYLGRILGTLISAFVLAIIILYRIFKLSKPKINYSYWKYAFKIGLPIIPHGLSQIVLSQFDRLMINHLNDSSSAGLYSFAYNIAIIFQVVVTSLDTVWSQWFFDKMAENKVADIRKVSSIYCIIVSIGAIILMLVSPELIGILGGVKYNDSKSTAVIILLAMYFSFLYYFPASIEYFYKKTIFIGIGTVGAAILNVALNLIFIPHYGYIAAAYTTLACYLFYYVVHTIISYYIKKEFVYNMKLQFIMMIFTSFMTAVSVCFIHNMLVRYIVVIIVFTALGIIAYKNKNVIVDIIGKIKTRKSS